MVRDIDRVFLRDISRDVVAFKRSLGMEPNVRDMLDDTFGVAQTEFTNYLMQIALADRKITNEEIAIISTSLERRLTQENIEEMVYDGSDGLNNISLTAAVWADDRAQGATSKAKKLIELYKTAGTELVFCDVANSQISSYNTREKSLFQKTYIQGMSDYIQMHNKYAVHERDDFEEAEFEHKESDVKAPSKRGLFERVKDFFQQ